MEGSTRSRLPRSNGVAMLGGDRAINRKDTKRFFAGSIGFMHGKKQTRFGERKMAKEGTKIYISPHGEEIVS